MSIVAERPRRGPVRTFVRSVAQNRIAYLFLLPAAVLITVVNFVPMAQAFITSTYQYSLFRPRSKPFVGLENFTEQFADPLFWRALWQTGVYTGSAVAGQFLLGLLAAVLLNRSFMLRGLFRGLVLIPWVIPGSLAGVMFALLFTSNGLINTVASGLGLVKLGVIPANFPWLSNPASAMTVLIVTSTWKGFPFFAVMLLAAMQGVPDDLYEAARVDGADRWRQFVHVTLPGIRMTILVALLLQTIWTFNSLDLIYVMTNGGPAHATTTLVMLAYQAAFGLGQIGDASAIAVSALVIVGAIAWIYLLLYRKLGATQ